MSALKSRTVKRSFSAAPFSASFGTLARGFRGHGIPTATPGFCDHPKFLDQERTTPDLLNHFAAFVARRTYDEPYLAHAKNIIENLSRMLHAELLVNGRLGACVDISGILMRALHCEQIWACGIKGSLTITFPPESGIERRYFWSIDHGDFVAGHAWVFAPPYTIVDVTCGRQPYDQREHPFMPNVVVASPQSRSRIELEDVVSPSAIAELLSHGVPKERVLYSVRSALPHISSIFPAQTVPGQLGAELKYVPVAIIGLDGTFESMSNMTFQGHTPWELYTNTLAPELRQLGL